MFKNYYNSNIFQFNKNKEFKFSTLIKYIDSKEEEKIQELKYEIKYVYLYRN